MKRAGIVALIAMGIVSAMFIEQAGAAPRVEETSKASLSPVTMVDGLVVLLTVLVGIVARPKQYGLPLRSKVTATLRWPVRISVERDAPSKFLIPHS